MARHYHRLRLLTMQPMGSNKPASPIGMGLTGSGGAEQAKYDADYGTFAGHPGYESETRYAQSLIRLLERRGLVTISPDMSHLDLCCGLGFKTRALAGSFGSSEGVDFSRTGIELANRLNDLDTLRFSFLDVETGTLGRRFDLVSAFGVSPLNTPDAKTYAEWVASFLHRFVEPGGTLLVVGQSDFSGAYDDGWFNHTRPQLQSVRELVNRVFPTSLYFPNRDPRTYLSLGMEHALREVAKLALRRRRDYCLVARKSHRIDQGFSTRGTDLDESRQP
jgi:SAM-dependent methyltransferase